MAEHEGGARLLGSLKHAAHAVEGGLKKGAQAVERGAHKVGVSVGGWVWACWALGCAPCHYLSRCHTHSPISIINLSLGGGRGEARGA